MLRVDSKWNETKETLLKKAIESRQKRVRERFICLFLVATGMSAVEVGKLIGRNRMTIASWVNRFNQKGLKGVTPLYRGRSRRILTEDELTKLGQVVRKSPRDSGFEKVRWSIELLANYIERQFGKKVRQSTIRGYLHQLGLGARAFHRRGGRIRKVKSS